MSLPRYPKYKVSGVEWLGEVPEHWAVKRLKNNLRLLTEKTDRRIHAIGLENIEGWTGRYISSESEFEGEGVAFEPGDILFGKLRPYLAKVHLAESAGEAVGDFHVLRPSAEADGRFFQYQMLNGDFIAIVDGSTFGSKMPRASWEFVGDMRLATPPTPEQIIIASFLDRETAKIDALVAEQRRLIELLKEKRQAVISHAVTKGLNPHAPMKPSGIEWLGEVPKLWTMTKLGRFAAVTKLTGFEYTTHWAVEPDGEILALRGYNIKRGKLVLENVERISSRLSTFLSRSKLHKGDIVFPCTGSVGDAAIIPEDDKYHINQNIAKITFDGLVTSEFALIFLFSAFAKQQFELLNTSGVQPVILIGNIRELMIVVPPIDEQMTIVSFLDSEIAKVDELTVEAERAIDLLQEAGRR